MVPVLSPREAAMSRNGASIGAAALTLSESSGVPMYRQLYEHLRRAILDGRLRPGAQLPSTRGLADELAVARNTVMGAYEQLLAEGYLEGETGSGTYVARTLPDEILQAPRIPAARSQLRTSVGMSRRGQIFS